MAFTWIEDPVEELTLPSGNTIKVKRVDILDLVMGDQAGAVPDTLLQQVSDSFSGNAKDRELLCHSLSVAELPMKGEPVFQGTVRGRVVDAVGDREFLRVTVSMMSGAKFETGPIRFGGIKNATVQSEGEARWRPEAKDMPKFGEFMRLIVKAAAVEPKLVDEVTNPDTELAISKVNSTDKMHIFMWAMPQEVRPAGTFPEGEAEGVAVTPDVQGVPTEPSGRAGAEASVGEVAV